MIVASILTNAANTDHQSKLVSPHLKRYPCSGRKSFSSSVSNPVGGILDRYHSVTRQPLNNRNHITPVSHSYHISVECNRRLLVFPFPSRYGKSPLPPLPTATLTQVLKHPSSHLRFHSSYQSVPWQEYRNQPPPRRVKITVRRKIFRCSILFHRITINQSSNQLRICTISVCEWRVTTWQAWFASTKSCDAESFHKAPTFTSSAFSLAIPCGSTT